jgi:hypothetical protein
MLRYLALAISLGMALPFPGPAILAASIECYPACDDLGAASGPYDNRNGCNHLVEEAGDSCADVVNSYSNDADASPYRRSGREPVRHPAPGRVVPDASFFGLY